MNVARELTVGVAPEAVWRVLWGVPRMVECVPGCVQAREVEPRRRYEAWMTQRVGPLVLSVPLAVEVAEPEPGALALTARGRDPAVGAIVSMTVRLRVEPAGAGSRLRIDAEGQVLGKLGALGHSVIQRKAEELMDEFAARLRQAVEG